MGTLGFEITQSLKSKQATSDFRTALLGKDTGRVAVRDESELWDYKETIDLSDAFGKAEFARDLLGFANAGGGAIIVGVAKDYRVVGYPKSQVLDIAQIKEKTQPYTGPSLELFQTTIDLPTAGKCLWIIFVCKRKGSPLAALAHGPQKSNRPIFAKGDYFIRVGDQIKKCTEPHDFERLFAGYTFSHIQAYLYDLDIPYFRLLAPHCEQFVGRHDLIADLTDALNSRHFIFSLDGMGGVGKSAVAIEVVRKIYEIGEHYPIISLSAKHRVWTGVTGSRQAGFSGLGELLREMASVMGLEAKASLEELKADVIANLEGNPGILLLDNMEEVSDPGVLKFISREVPEPTKVIVTSRIDRGLGGLTFSVKEMTPDEAKVLLTSELNRLGYHSYITEREPVEELIRVTGRLPLAIKWACVLALERGNLAAAVRELKGSSLSKKEFLDFCFKTMFDTLPTRTREVALLCPYLGEEWNTSTISIALDISLEEAAKCVHELKERGIIFASRTGDSSANQLLPLTVDFLRDEFSRQTDFRNRVMKNLSDAFATTNTDGLLFSWSSVERVNFLSEATRQRHSEGDFEKARQLVKLAIHLDNSPELAFLNGRIEYESGNIAAGLAYMKNALDLSRNSAQPLSADDVEVLAEALFKHGNQEDERQALLLVLEILTQRKAISTSLLSTSVKRAIQVREYRLLASLFNQLNALGRSDYMYTAAEPVLASLTDHNVVHHLGQVVVSILNGAANWSKIDEEMKSAFRLAAEEAGSILSGTPTKQAKSTFQNRQI